MLQNAQNTHSSKPQLQQGEPIQQNFTKNNNGLKYKKTDIFVLDIPTVLSIIHGRDFNPENCIWADKNQKFREEERKINTKIETCRVWLTICITILWIYLSLVQVGTTSVGVVQAYTVRGIFILMSFFSERYFSVMLFVTIKLCDFNLVQCP